MNFEGFSDCLKNEIEVLLAVYNKELNIELNENFLKIVINLPMESIKDALENFLYLKLEISCNKDYPFSDPRILITDYWGVEDTDIKDLYKILRKLISTEICNPESLIYHIIQITSDNIDHNTPKSKCSICLDIFNEPDNIYATPAHHFFHKYCIETFALSEIEEHNLIVQEARKNNPFILLKDLPKLSIRCPNCRNEELSFDKLSNGDINSWKENTSSIIYNTSEVNEYLHKITLEMKLRKEINDKNIDDERETNNCVLKEELNINEDKFHENVKAENKINLHSRNFRPNSRDYRCGSANRYRGYNQDIRYNNNIYSPNEYNRETTDKYSLNKINQRPNFNVSKTNANYKINPPHHKCYFNTSHQSYNNKDNYFVPYTFESNHQEVSHPFGSNNDSNVELYERENSSNLPQHRHRSYNYKGRGSFRKG